MPPPNIRDEDCVQWRLHPNVNPITNRIIETDGDVYMNFVRRCGNPTAVPLASGTARQNQETIRQNIRMNTPVLPTPTIRRSARIARLQSQANTLATETTTPAPTNAPIPAPAPVPAPAPRRTRTTTTNTRPRTRVPTITPTTQQRQTQPEVLTIQGIPEMPVDILRSLVTQVCPDPPREIAYSIDILYVPQSTISIYEAERYISRFIARGINAYINPITNDYVYSPSQDVLNYLKSICANFRLPRERANFTNTSAVILNNSYFFTQTTARVVRSNNQSTTYQIYELERFAQSVRDSSTSTVRHPTENREVEISTDPNSEFAELSLMAYMSGLDMNELVRRIELNVYRPVITLTPFSRGSKAEKAWQAYQALYQTGFRDGIIMTPLLATPLTRQLLRQFTQESVNILLQNMAGVTGAPSIIASIPKTPITTPATSPTDVHPTCIQTLSDLDPYFAPFTRKLKKICTNMSKECGETASVQTALVDYLVNHPLNSSYVYQNLRIDPEYVLAHVFNVWNTIRGDQRLNSLYVIIGVFSGIRYTGQEGVGQGVTRSFLQRIMDELEIYGVFAPYPGNASNRYFINPSFEPNQKFKDIIGFRFRTEVEFTIFYEFIGQLLIFVLMNNIGLPFQLSYSILAHMIYKHDEIKPYDYVGYYMIDFPDEFVGLANFMRDADTIEHVGMEFRDEFNLKLPRGYTSEDNAPITKETYQEYLENRAEYRYLHHLYPRESRQSGSALDINNRFNALVKGFDKIRKFLRSQHITIQMLDKLISQGKINTQVIRAFTTKFQDLMNDVILGKPETERAKLTALKDLMIRIFEDEGETYPYDVHGMERPTQKEERVQQHRDFIGRLLMFWTSYRAYKPAFNYLVTIQRPENMDAGRRIQNRRELTAQEKAEMLPEAHTCFQRLDIPETYANDLEKLYRKLVQASSMAEAGIGNYGGSKKSKKRKQKTKQGTKK